MEEKEISSLEQLYSELKPFCTLRYAYEKYINAPRMGLSDKIEEKIYKYKLVDGDK